MSNLAIIKQQYKNFLWVMTETGETLVSCDLGIDFFENEVVELFIKNGLLWARPLKSDPLSSSEITQILKELSSI